MEVVLAEVVPALPVVDNYVGLVVLIVDGLEDVEETVNRYVLVSLLISPSFPTLLE